MLREGARYHDISPEIRENLAVFPGDVPFRRDVTVDFGGGANYLASAIHGTVHLGAHTDAPGHYHKGGASIERRSLDFYLGDCQVISVRAARGARLTPADLGGTKVRAKRVPIWKWVLLNSRLLGAMKSRRAVIPF